VVDHFAYVPLSVDVDLFWTLGEFKEPEPTDSIGVAVAHDGAGVEQQRAVFDDIYDPQLDRWSSYGAEDPLVRFLRDRRIKIGVQRAMKISGATPKEWDALVVCGGVGGEGTLLANLGFRSVTVSDISENAVEICKVRDPRLKTSVLNAEAMSLPDKSFDLVLVQDGLHHLPRPMLGYTEMLRVARRAVIVVEPHAGLVAKLIGTTWEKHDDEINYVFRWNQLMLEEPARSVLLDSSTDVKAIRLWDHNLVVGKLIRKLRIGSGRTAVSAAKFLYAALNIPFSWLGNNMVGVVVKTDSEENAPPVQRPTG
jgi:ubiquinone/menaquinone biosynthesis C-methylase UbiE